MQRTDFLGLSSFSCMISELSQDKDIYIIIYLGYIISWIPKEFGSFDRHLAAD